MYFCRYDRIIFIDFFADPVSVSNRIGRCFKYYRGGLGRRQPREVFGRERG